MEDKEAKRTAREKHAMVSPLSSTAQVPKCDPSSSAKPREAFIFSLVSILFSLPHSTPHQASFFCIWHEVITVGISDVLVASVLSSPLTEASRCLCRSIIVSLRWETPGRLLSFFSMKSLQHIFTATVFFALWKSFRIFSVGCASQNEQEDPDT